jgi:hypothetical protein
MVAPPILDDPDIEEPSERPLSAGRNAQSSRPVLIRIDLIKDDASVFPFHGHVISAYTADKRGRSPNSGRA